MSSGASGGMVREILVQVAPPLFVPQRAAESPEKTCPVTQQTVALAQVSPSTMEASVGKVDDICHELPPSLVVATAPRVDGPKVQMFRFVRSPAELVRHGVLPGIAVWPAMMQLEAVGQEMMDSGVNP